MGKEADVSGAGKRDEPLRTSAWEAAEFNSPLLKVFIRSLNGLLHLISVSLSVEDLPFLLTPFNLKRLNKIAFSSENFLPSNTGSPSKNMGPTPEEYGSPREEYGYTPAIFLFEGRLALNSGLNLTRVSFSFVQKHFLGYFLCYF